MGDLGLVEILAIVGGLAFVLMLLYVFQVAKRTREEIRFRAKRAGLAAVLYASSVIILRSQGYTPWETLAFSFLVALTPAVLIKAPKRARYIPAWVRKAVVARDLKGQPVDPRTHHIDHVVPYSKYGDHSPENLRVVPKDYNLRRGARMPGFLEVLGHKPRLMVCVFLLVVVGFVSGLVRNAKSPENPTDQGIRQLASSAPATSAEGFGNTLSSLPKVNESPVQTGTPAPPQTPEHLEVAQSETTKTSGPTQEVPSPSTHEENPITAATPPSDTTASVSPETPMVRTFTTTELFAFYTRDKRTADYLIKGQVVRVSGTVLKVGMNEVQLRTEGDPDTVKCKADSSRAFVRDRPTLGTVAVVTGRVRGRGILGDITLDGCEPTQP